jgi:hypothetical protein
METDSAATQGNAVERCRKLVQGGQGLSRAAGRASRSSSPLRRSRPAWLLDVGQQIEVIRSPNDFFIVVVEFRHLLARVAKLLAC